MKCTRCGQSFVTLYYRSSKGTRNLFEIGMGCPDRHEWNVDSKAVFDKPRRIILNLSKNKRPGWGWWTGQELFVPDEEISKVVD